MNHGKRKYNKGKTYGSYAGLYYFLICHYNAICFEEISAFRSFLPFTFCYPKRRWCHSSECFAQHFARSPIVSVLSTPVQVLNQLQVMTSSCLYKLLSDHSNPTLTFLRCLCTCGMYLGITQMLNMHLVFLYVLFVLGVCISFRPPLRSSLSRSQLSPQSVQEWVAHCFDGHRWGSCDQFFWIC